MVKHAEGEAYDVLLWGDKGANFVFRVITSDRKHFSNTDPLCIAPAQVCVCVRGGGVKIGLPLFGSF